MSIKIGNTITNPNNFTNKERVSLSSMTESNLIIMQSKFSDVNISLYSGLDTNYFTIGKSSNVFKITENNTSIASFSITCNVFYAPTYFNNSLIIGQSLNIGSTLTANELNTTLIKITPSTLLPSRNYFLASNTNGLLMSANTNGFVNIVGNVNIGNMPYNPQYSLMVDNNVNIGNILNVPTINTTTLVTTNITNNRITGQNTNSYIDFGSGYNNQRLQFNSFISGQPVSCTQLTGNFTVNGTIYANDVQTLNPATSFALLNITSNLSTASETLTNTPNIKQPSLLIEHTNYSNTDIFDINLYTYTSNYNTNTIDKSSVDALTIDAFGRVQIGAIQYTNSLFSVQTTINNASITSNLFTLIGNDSNNSIVYINNTGDIGIGTTNPTSRLHITQCYGDTSSNTPLVVLYAQNYTTSNYDTDTNITNISDLIAGYSNNNSVFYVNSTGDITGNSVNTSNSVSCKTLNVSLINANNMNNTINYNNSSISNINTVNTINIYTDNINTSNTISTSNLTAYNINTQNFFIPNLEIFNDMGYYAVYTQQLWFTGSNIVMSSLNSDRIADASQGKLVVRTDDQIIVGSANAIGLNAIGTQKSSIRVTSQQQPNYELFGPNTSTYIGATKTDNGYGPNMFYINHLVNQSSGSGNTSVDNINYSQFRMYATNNTGITGGTVLENLIYIKYNNVGNNTVGIGLTNPIYTLQTQGSFLSQRIDNSLPILYANSISGGTIQVGVGTTNVFTQLDVMGTIYARSTVGGTIGNIYTDGSIGIGLAYNNTPLANLHVVGGGYFTNNIGIGTLPSASYALHVNGNTNIINTLYASNIGIGITTPTSYSLDVNGNVNFRSNVIINELTVVNQIQTDISGSANTVRASLQPNIGILNNVEITTLRVSNPIQGNISGTSFVVANPYQSNIQYLENVQSIGTNSTNVQNITLGSQNTNTFISGNAIIGQTTNINTSNASLYVKGVGLFNSNLTVQGRLITYGNIGSISDKTIKTDLIQITSPLDKIDKLTGYTYTRTDIETTVFPTRETGLIAQDVNEVLPEVVYKNIDVDNLLTISYGNMAGLWVEAFKEMRAEINALKQRIVQLEQK